MKAVMLSGVFRGRATVRWPPPLARPWKFFTGDFIWKGAFFVIFQQELQNSTMFDGLLHFQILEKWANLRFPLNIQKQKVFQLQGGFARRPPDQGLCPWTPLGALPLDPHYRLTLRALAMAPPLSNPKYATGYAIGLLRTSFTRWRYGRKPLFNLIHLNCSFGAAPIGI